MAVGTEIAAYLAPLALAQNKTVAVTGASAPVRVSGNADTIGRAIRNLVENALAHTPAHTAVEIAIDPAGLVAGRRSRTGVPAPNTSLSSGGSGATTGGGGSAGLGLSIVARIAEMHRAAVDVSDRPGGGAVFTIRFPACDLGRNRPQTSTRNCVLTIGFKVFCQRAADDLLDGFDGIGHDLHAAVRLAFPATPTSRKIP